MGAGREPVLEIIWGNLILILNSENNLYFKNQKVNQHRTSKFYLALKLKSFCLSAYSISSYSINHTLDSIFNTKLLLTDLYIPGTWKVRHILKGLRTLNCEFLWCEKYNVEYFAEDISILLKKKPVSCWIYKTLCLVLLCI